MALVFMLIAVILNISYRILRREDPCHDGLDDDFTTLTQVCFFIATPLSLERPCSGSGVIIQVPWSSHHEPRTGKNSRLYNPPGLTLTDPFLYP
ncbi:hypothetical protein T265_03718 [Opisthorchis viverrini]|uniref:Bestrophin homolog n=1 Tax=Opisthorchis viverrini TaxID=6198 RepID=A0A074ZRK1_OPIVI|nr:hypothetical protein T265_03718 [Opisthorchis viverrini]KER29701.1 hypothetical protein T265_03718 [Opisthorchis viverrini]